MLLITSSSHFQYCMRFAAVSIICALVLCIVTVMLTVSIMHCFCVF